MYIVFAKRIGRCDFDMFADENWDFLKRVLVEEYGPDFEKAMDHTTAANPSAWTHLREGDTVMLHGEMFCLYQKEQHGEKHTLFANGVILDISEYDL